MTTPLIEAEHTTAAAQVALHNALVAVANTVTNNEDDLRALPRSEAVQEILDALDAWKHASETFLSAVQAEQTARRREGR